MRCGLFKNIGIPFLFWIYSFFDPRSTRLDISNLFFTFFFIEWGALRFSPSISLIIEHTSPVKEWSKKFNGLIYSPYRRQWECRRLSYSGILAAEVKLQSRCNPDRCVESQQVCSGKEGWHRDCRWLLSGCGVLSRFVASTFRQKRCRNLKEESRSRK